MPDCVYFGVIPEFDSSKSYYLSDNFYEGCFEDHLEKFNCVPISDDIVNELIRFTRGIPTYFGSADRAGDGIDHWGITLIPPESVKRLIDVIEENRETIAAGNEDEAKDIDVMLTKLRKAYDTGKYAICYGI